MKILSNMLLASAAVVSAQAMANTASEPYYSIFNESDFAIKVETISDNGGWGSICMKANSGFQGSSLLGGDIYVSSITVLTDLADDADCRAPIEGQPTKPAKPLAEIKALPQSYCAISHTEATALEGSFSFIFTGTKTVQDPEHIDQMPSNVMCTVGLTVGGDFEVNN
jgi:hypothetical protein